MEQTTKKGHPKGLYLLFVTEMWERFSYYGMRAIFSLYMLKALMFDKVLNSSIYGSYTGLVYLTPLIGGYVADRYWGNRRSILVGALLMALGQFLLFISAVFYEDIANGQGGLALFAFYSGLGFLIFGNGFFKPNISTMVGQLYPKGDNRLDSAMTIFYMGINLGAFIAPLIAGGLGDTGDPSDFKWGFLAAAIGMVISTISFELFKNKYIVDSEGNPVGMAPKKKQKTAEEIAATPKLSPSKVGGLIALYLGIFSLFFYGLDFDVIGSFIFSTTVIAMISVITDGSLSKVEKQRIGVIYTCALFVIFFWSAFEQAGVSLTFFAEEQTDRSLFGKTIPASWFQSVNAAFIVIFAPIIAYFWTVLDKKGKEPSSIYKQAIGLFLLALGYLFIAFGVQGIDPSMKVSMFWLVGLYWLHTMGELSLSPIGLSMVVKLSPVKFSSLLMGVWFLAMATANKFAGELSGLYPEEQKVTQSFVLTPEKQAQFGNVFEELSFKTGYYNPEESIKDFKVKISSDETEEAFEAGISDYLLKRKPKKRLDLTELTIVRHAFESYPLIKMNRILPGEPDEKAKARLGDYAGPTFSYAFSADQRYMYYFEKQEADVSLQVWDLSPDKPSFVGFEIRDLYDFFMIFVFMAGGASFILFLIGRTLIRMMNGVR
jgi:proton-dependent oligopeptide transporter, POT family